MTYRFDGRQKTLSFGPFPSTSLSAARGRKEEAKRLIRTGVDPSVQAKLDSINRKALSQNTFSAIGAELLQKQEREGKALITIRKKRWLLDVAEKSLGNRPIHEIKAPEIWDCLKRVENQGKHETAHRLRIVVGEVFRHAIRTGRSNEDPTFHLRGALTQHQVKHRAALTGKDEFRGLVSAIWGYTGTPETQAALKLMVLLYPRPGELRLAEWSEFDLDKRVWTIPAPHTKMRREHSKPLSGSAVKILEDLRSQSTSSALVFPSRQSPGRPLCENTLNNALRRLGYDKSQHTSHGFRASASTLLNESGLWSSDLIEFEQGRVGSDRIKKIYNRANYYQQRVEMSEWWAIESGAVALNLECL